MEDRLGRVEAKLALLLSHFQIPQPHPNLPPPPPPNPPQPPPQNDPHNPPPPSPHNDNDTHHSPSPHNTPHNSPQNSPHNSPSHSNTSNHQNSPNHLQSSNPTYPNQLAEHLSFHTSTHPLSHIYLRDFPRLQRLPEVNIPSTPYSSTYPFDGLFTDPSWFP